MRLAWVKWPIFDRMKTEPSEAQEAIRKLEMQVFYKPVKKRIYDTPEPIPVGEAVDTDWAVWAETVGFQDSQPMDFQVTDKMALAPLNEEFLDAFASVTKKGR